MSNGYSTQHWGRMEMLSVDGYRWDPHNFYTCEIEDKRINSDKP